MVRFIVAASVAGVAVFIWGVLIHVFSPLGEAGFSTMPQEAPVLEAMRANLPKRGLYFFPGPPSDGTPEQMSEWEARYRAGPNGILVYDPSGSEPVPPMRLVIELTGNILGALLLGALLSVTTLSLRGRVLFSAGVGLIGWLAISVPHWNWYGFPTAFALAEAIDQVGAWAVAGLVFSLVLRRRKASPAPGV